MISNVTLPLSAPEGTQVTVDAERGVVYEDAIGDEREDH